VEVRGGVVRVFVRVRPRASRNEVVGTHAGRLKVQVTAPPVDGAANQAVVDLLADYFGVPRRSVSIARGSSGRDKTVAVESLGRASVEARVRELLDQ